MPQTTFSACSPACSPSEQRGGQRTAWYRSVQSNPDQRPNADQVSGDVFDLPPYFTLLRNDGSPLFFFFLSFLILVSTARLGG
jgi:hypothetical protein